MSANTMSSRRPDLKPYSAMKNSGIEWLGKVPEVPIAWTTAPVTINQDMKALVPAKWILAKYLALALDACQDAFVPLIDEAGHGTRRLPPERWKNLIIAVPPMDEQSAIIENLDQATDDVYRTIDRSRREIALLREYRIRLIADVVTGKLDVRQAVAGFPDEPDDSEPIGEAADLIPAGNVLAGEPEAIPEEAGA